MKVALTLLLVQFAIISHCQSIPDRIRRVHTLTLSISPGVAFRTLNYSDNEKWIEQERNFIETPGFAFQVSVHYVRQLNNTISVRAGLQFEIEGYRTMKQPLVWPIAEPGQPKFSRTVTNFHQLALPLDVQWLVRDKNKIKSFLFAGVAPSALASISTRIKTYPDAHTNNKSTKSTGYTRFGLTGRAGIENWLSLDSKNSIHAGLLMDYSITDRKTDETASEHGYAFYLTLGFCRRLGR